MKVAILIAVQHYLDKSFLPIKYAKADALEFGKVIKDHGFDEVDQVVFIDAEATKLRLESELESTIQSLNQGDTLFLYYVGHSFSKNGQNYLTCYDTQRSDHATTSVPLNLIFHQLRKSDCNHFAMFFDSCESGLNITQENCGSDSDSAEEEWKAFFETSNHSVCFAACKPPQNSYPNKLVQHGAWADNLIEAFRGSASDALVNGILLTANSLQHYLTQAVGRTLRQAYTDKKDQTPWTLGLTSGDFILADLTDILKKRIADSSSDSRHLVNLSFVRRQNCKVRSLRGFKKQHRVPDEINSRAVGFINQISDDQLAQNLNDVFKSLRKEFRFKRKDIEVFNSGEGGGTIITPYFTYSEFISLNPDDHSEVVWQNQVSDIKEPDQILAEEFENVFGEMFDTVEFSPPQKVDLETLIDKIEDLEDDRITLDYEPELTACNVKIEGITGQIKVTPSKISIVHHRSESPKKLLETFFQLQTAFIDNQDIGLITFE